MMELAPGCRPKNKMKKHLHCAAGRGIGLDSETLLVIKLPDSLVLRIIGRSFLLAIFIIALPCIGPMLNGHSNSFVDDYEPNVGPDSIDFEFFNMVFRDLADEGLIERGDKALISISGIESVAHSVQFLSENEINVVIMDCDDVERMSSIANESFDLAFTSSFQNVEFIDRVVKTGGIVVVSLEDFPLSNAYIEQSNYEIVYLRRLSFIIVAMIKSASANEVASSSTKRRLCALASEAKKVTLKGLEYALQPPRQALAGSNKYITGKFVISDWLVKNVRREKPVMMMKAEVKSDGGDDTNEDALFGGITSFRVQEANGRMIGRKIRAEGLIGSA